jgi:hypothetical protein
MMKMMILSLLAPLFSLQGEKDDDEDSANKFLASRIATPETDETKQNRVTRK